jgi:primosomal protein N' (replication factor Y)
VAAGTRSVVFAPLKNLGLIIVDSESAYAYKQNQSPHYNAREAALIRGKLEGAKVILGAVMPSLEAFYPAGKPEAGRPYLKPKPAQPEIKVIDMNRAFSLKGHKGMPLSRFLEDAVFNALIAKEKVLLLLNRKGFATIASCHNCGKVLKCPRCSVNLAYHFHEGTLSCRHCNFKTAPPKTCDSCHAGYIKYSGAGTEKIESELSRIFPQARILRWEQKSQAAIEDADIFISTSAIAGHAEYRFDVVCVLAIDNSLNHADFRAAEKSFILLGEALALTKKKFIIQTRLVNHHLFKALENNDPGIFYDTELKERKQLGLPPYTHLALIKTRGRSESRVREAAENLFAGFKGVSTNKKVGVLSLNPGEPAKLRGNFYWQILIRAGSAQAITKFLKKNLKKFRRPSGIIVTVDVDPV